jgi:hypothetical protein
LSGLSSYLQLTIESTLSLNPLGPIPHIQGIHPHRLKQECYRKLTPKAMIELEYGELQLMKEYL